MIYLDAAATSKPKKEVIDAMMPYFTEMWQNSSSLYGSGAKIKQDIRRARKVVADYIGARLDEVYFTSGGSEGNCWAIRGFVDYWISHGVKPTVITTKIEHKSIMSCVKDLNGVDVYYVDVDEKGFINLQNLDIILHNNHLNRPNNMTLVSIQFANNEIGTVQNIKEISEIAHRYNAVFHTDAVQALGQIPIDVDELGIDMMTASGHKIGCPKGIGFLYKKSCVPIKPLIYGSQMDGLRGGTENVPYIIGMAEAIKSLKKDDERLIRLTVLRNNFISQLKSLGCKVNGCLNERLPNNINVTFPQNITGEALLYTLDLAGIAISTGSACNSTSIEPSYVLEAIGLSDKEAMRTIRITLSEEITGEDIDVAFDEICKAVKLIEMGEDC